jgi:hypothetical protein
MANSGWGSSLGPSGLADAFSAGRSSPRGTAARCRIHESRARGIYTWKDGLIARLLPVTLIIPEFDLLPILIRLREGRLEGLFSAIKISISLMILARLMKLSKSLAWVDA